MSDWIDGQHRDAYLVAQRTVTAFAAREEPTPTGLGDAVREVCNEWVQANGVGVTSDWHVQRLLPLADRIDVALARDDTERPHETMEETATRMIADALGIAADSPSAMELGARVGAALGTSAKRFLLAELEAEDRTSTEEER